MTKTNLAEDLKMISFLKKHYYIDAKEASFMRKFIEDLLFAEKNLRYPKGDYLCA